MKGPDHLTYQLLEQSLLLFPEKALYWKERKTLVISDLHLGKSGHFRKHGIPVPETVNQNNLHRLDDLVNRLPVQKIIFLGDLFHSELNKEYDEFKKWRFNYSELDIFLTIGNHDILSLEEYEQLSISYDQQLLLPPFLFTHDVKDTDLNRSYTLSGHVHPSVKVKGKGRQTENFPCFYFKENYALLPAFGSFTGTYLVTPKSGEKIFGIVADEIIDLTSKFSPD